MMFLGVYLLQLSWIGWRVLRKEAHKQEQKGTMSDVRMLLLGALLHVGVGVLLYLDMLVSQISARGPRLTQRQQHLNFAILHIARLLSPLRVVL
jgi:hypothetical protein